MQIADMTHEEWSGSLMYVANDKNNFRTFSEDHKPTAEQFGNVFLVLMQNATASTYGRGLLVINGGGKRYRIIADEVLGDGLAGTDLLSEYSRIMTLKSHV